MAQMIYAAPVLTRLRAWLDDRRSERRQREPAMGVIERLIYARNRPIIGRVIHEILALYGVEVPPQVTIGHDLRVEHRGKGLVLSANTLIGDRVRLFHQVTTGTKEIAPGQRLPDVAVILEDDVTVYPGAKIFGGMEPTRVGAGTTVLANAVLTRSTGEWEIWGGVPAEKIGDRERRVVAPE